MGVETPDDPIFRNLNLTKLKLDEAYVEISTTIDPNSNYLYLRSDDCYKCPFRSYDQFFDDYSKVSSCFGYLNYLYWNNRQQSYILIVIIKLCLF